jgi:O-antigen ligase
MFDHRNVRRLRFRKVLGMALLGVLVVALLGFLVTGLWNALLPSLFGLRPIHFWQALGLLALCRILFGGFHHRHGRPFGSRRRLLERWERMTPEERAAFREGFRNHRFCREREPQTGS